MHRLAHARVVYEVVRGLLQFGNVNDVVLEIHQRFAVYGGDLRPAPDNALVIGLGDGFDALFVGGLTQGGGGSGGNREAHGEVLGKQRTEVAGECVQGVVCGCRLHGIRNGLGELGRKLGGRSHRWPGVEL